MTERPIILDGPVATAQRDQLIYQITMPNGAILTNPGMFETPGESVQGVRWGDLLNAVHAHADR